MFRLWWRLSSLGLIGVASFLLVPVETWLPVKLDPVLLRLLSTVQPALLVILAAAVGVWAAPKVGLHAPAVEAWTERRAVLPELRSQLAPGILVGITVAAVLIAYVVFIRQAGEASVLLRFTPPLATRLLYGGLTEEVLLRWGLMSLLVWVGWRLSGRLESVQLWVVWTGIILSALLFGIGHLPALSQLLPNPPDWLIATVVGANFIAGMFFGWLFWSRGLEAAMIAHASAHLFAWAALLLL